MIPLLGGLAVEHDLTELGRSKHDVEHLPVRSQHRGLLLLDSILDHIPMVAEHPTEVRQRGVIREAYQHALARREPYSVRCWMTTKIVLDGDHGHAPVGWDGRHR